VTLSKSTIGKGLSIKEIDKPNEDFINWLTCVNNKRQNFDTVLLNSVDGERTQGNQFIEVVRGSLAGKRYIKVYPKSFLFCRLNNPDDYSNPTSVIISKQLAKQKYVVVDDALEIPLWSENPLDKKEVWWTDKNGDEHTMLHFKNEVSGIEHYGMPASVAGLRYQVLEGKTAQYNIDNLDNNMVLGGLLVFKSGMTQEEAQKQAKEILLSHVGEGKTGRIAVLSSEEGIDSVQFIPYSTQKEGSFIESDKHVQEKIIIANEWDSLLAGISRAGSLGSGSEYIRSIFDVKEAVLLNPLRKRVIDNIVKPIVQIWSDWMGVKDVLKYEFEFKSQMPFSFMGDLDPETFMKVKEARSLAGLEPDEANGEKYLSEMGGKSKNNVQSKSPSAEGSNNNG
jgi:capsid portal protein